jgi:anthranilate/para-aminobenzoate synthase component II
MPLVMIDNYDFFTHNLAHFFYKFYFGEVAYRHDQIGIEEIEAPRTICSS